MAFWDGTGVSDLFSLNMYFDHQLEIQGFRGCNDPQSHARRHAGRPRIPKAVGPKELELSGSTVFASAIVADEHGEQSLLQSEAADMLPCVKSISIW